MFSPENEDGNIEYKRHLCSEELKSFNNGYNIRFQQLITQLKYRLDEGNGIAIYYIGVNDDGSIYKLSNNERSTSLLVLKKMVIHLEAKIESTIFNKNYIKITIKDKWKSNIFPEKRILLLGDSESGKTTFLSYLIKNKLDSKNCKARLFILNHKHELESGKTSSFNYQYKDYKNTKYVFIDTPGAKSNKIRSKIILSFDFDLVIFFNKPNETWDNYELFTYYCSFFKIPFININLFDIQSEINLIEPIKQSEILEKIKNKIDNDNKKINNILTNFYLLQSYPHVDMGWILSGFLSSGNLETGQQLYWYDYDKVNVKIDSIYQNNLPVKKISGPCTITITLNQLNDINNKPRFGFLSNINYIETVYFKLIWIYFNNSSVLDEPEININVRNQYLLLKKEESFINSINKSKYSLKNPKVGFNLLNQYFIYEKDDVSGFGKIIK